MNDLLLPARLFTWSKEFLGPLDQSVALRGVTDASDIGAWLGVRLWAPSISQFTVHGDEADIVYRMHGISRSSYSEDIMAWEFHASLKEPQASVLRHLGYERSYIVIFND